MLEHAENLGEDRESARENRYALLGQSRKPQLADLAGADRLLDERLDDCRRDQGIAVPARAHDVADGANGARGAHRLIPTITAETSPALARARGAPPTGRAACVSR